MSNTHTQRRKERKGKRREGRGKKKCARICIQSVESMMCLALSLLCWWVQRALVRGGLQPGGGCWDGYGLQGAPLCRAYTDDPLLAAGTSERKRTGLGEAARSQSEPPVAPADHFPYCKASQGCFLSVVLSARLTVEAEATLLLRRRWSESKTMTKHEKTCQRSSELCFLWETNDSFYRSKKDCHRLEGKVHIRWNLSWTTLLNMLNQLTDLSNSDQMMPICIANTFLLTKCNINYSESWLESDRDGPKD